MTTRSARPSTPRQRGVGVCGDGVGSVALEEGGKRLGRIVHGGFVGRHPVSMLLDRGDEVVAIDRTAAGIPAGAQVCSGDTPDPGLQAEALASGCDALVHLATVPGGATEADPAGSRRINIDAMYDLLERAAEVGGQPRIVYASSIAVLGRPLSAEEVDDGTPLSPPTDLWRPQGNDGNRRSNALEREGCRRGDDPAARHSRPP